MSRYLAVLALAVAALAGCTADPDPAAGPPAPVVVQPGAPGQPGRTVDPAAEPGEQLSTLADVRFMHGMIPHHAQALELTGLVAGRTGDPEIALLARRIERSQAEEITRMEDWLAARGHPAGRHQHTGDELMPGMLTDRQLAGLAAATSAEFDRRFLELMTYHHEGALVMVAELFAAGGGQDGEIFQLAAHIEADQRIEIDRMRRMLAGLATG